MVETVEPRRETVSLIGSDKVEGTSVFGDDNEKIGAVERLMIDKVSGKVAFAVVSFGGGFLGLTAEDHLPIPWSSLSYDIPLQGYKLMGVTAYQLENAPKFKRDTEWGWTRENDRVVYGHYGQPLWY